jgi:hypothetical protein
MCLEGSEEVRTQLAGATIITPDINSSNKPKAEVNSENKLLYQCLTSSNHNNESVKTEVINVAIAKETIDDAVIRLSKLPQLQYEQVRKEEAKALSIRLSVLDSEVKKNSSPPPRPIKDNSNELENGIEPWPEQVTGTEIALDIQELLKNHVILDNHQITATVLWVFGSYCIDAFPIFPKLLLTSPTKRCGKTTLMRILHCIVHRSLIASNTSAAAIFRSVELWKPSLLIDEADTFIKGLIYITTPNLKTLQILLLLFSVIK